MREPTDPVTGGVSAAKPEPVESAARPELVESAAKPELVESAARPGLVALLAEARATWAARAGTPSWRPFEDAFPTFYQFTNRPR